MNKKILLSAAAAATLALTFTGCGSDDSSLTSTVSGNAVKAQLNGANVTFGGVTVQTDANGSFTVTGATSGDLITISGGTYTKDGVEKNNTAPIIATKAQVNAGVEASILTTLISKFGGDTNATEKAFKLLNIPYVANVDLSTKKAASFEDAALSIAVVMESADGNDTALSTVISSLQTSAEANITANSTINANGLTTALQAAANAAGVQNDKLNAILDAIETKKSFKYVQELEALAEDINATTISNDHDYNASAYTLSNTIDINATSGDANTSTFTLVNNDANLTNANGNTSLFVSIQGLDAANLNSSYAMALTGLDVALMSTGYITIKDNNTSVLSTLATSTLKKAVTTDLNASTKTSFVAGLLSDTNMTTSVNIYNFSASMKSAYMGMSDATSATPTYGSFSTGMEDGNYSVSVSINVNGQTISKNNKVTSVVPSSMATTDYNGEAVFTGLTGYQVIDSNLSK